MTAAPSRVVFCPKCAAPFTSDHASWHRLCPACRPAPKAVKAVRAPESKRCPICGAIFGKRANEAPSEFARRAFCSKSCGSRSRGARYAHLERPEPRRPTQTAATPPKPRMATQRLCGPKPEPTGTHLTTIPKKKKAMPTVDAGLCIHPARPVWFSDGAAVIAGLVATLPLCSRIVSGWLATVPSDADGYVTPRFTTAETAALFDQMVDNKTGRRAA